MTQPPTGPWGALPPSQPPGGWPGQPGQGGQPYPGQPGPPGQWGPQQQWPAPAPPKGGGAQKWIIGGLGALVVALVITLVAVSCVRSGDGKGSGGGTSATSGVASDVASANDTGPVGIITEDPSCAPFAPIANTLAGIQGKGWSDRDPSIPSPAWTPQVRAQYEAVGTAIRKTADQLVSLSKMTPHRVMRELYAQFIVYARAYADSIPTYAAADDWLVRTAVTASNTVGHICDAISSGSAAARASMVTAPAVPKSVAPIGDVSNPQRIFTSPDAVCPDIDATINQLLTSPVFIAWAATDPKIPMSNWSPQQQILNDGVAPVMSSTADALEKLANRSANPMVQDFILLGIQYRRTYVQALATYQPNDQSIYSAGQTAPGVVLAACKAISS